MVRTNTSPLALLLVCALGAVACQAKEGDGAGTERTNGQFQAGQVATGDGCASVPQQFPDGFAFERHADGRVRKGLIVKVIRDANAFWGAHAGYVQRSSQSTDPSRVTAADMGRYGAAEAIYGYSGGAYEGVYYNSIRPRFYRADGSEDLGMTNSFTRSGNNVTLNVVSNGRTVKQVGQGRFLSRVNGVDLYAIHAVNGACFGTASVRGRDAGMSGGQQHSVEGGSFAVYVGPAGSGGSTSGGGTCDHVIKSCQRLSDVAGCIARVAPQCAQGGQQQKLPASPQNQQGQQNQQNQQGRQNQQHQVPSHQVPAFTSTPKAGPSQAPVNNQQGVIFTK